jgi:hypothetical protein
VQPSVEFLHGIDESPNAGCPDAVYERRAAMGAKESGRRGARFVEPADHAESRDSFHHALRCERARRKQPSVLVEENKRARRFPRVKRGDRLSKKLRLALECGPREIRGTDRLGDAVRPSRELRGSGDALAVTGGTMVDPGSGRLFVGRTRCEAERIRLRPRRG